MFRLKIIMFGCQLDSLYALSQTTVVQPDLMYLRIYNF